MVLWFRVEHASQLFSDYAVGTSEYFWETAPLNEKGNNSVKTQR